MYKSKLLLNRQKIFNPVEIYQALSSYFPAPEKPFYRLEWYKIGVVVPMLMYSKNRPVIKQFPECQLLETTELENIPRDLKEAGFSIFAVPDLKKDWDTTDSDLITGWLQKKLKSAADISEVSFGPNNCLYYNVNEIEHQLQTVTIKGQLQIRNAAKLDEIRKAPIGLSPELGCGLLQIDF